jgi:predicted amidophosphoribosyltransferase
MTPTPDTRPRACRQCGWQGSNAETVPVIGSFGDFPSCPQCGGMDLAWRAVQPEPAICPNCKTPLDDDGYCCSCGKTEDELGGRAA